MTRPVRDPLEPLGRPYNNAGGELFPKALQDPNVDASQLVPPPVAKPDDEELLRPRFGAS